MENNLVLTGEVRSSRDMKKAGTDIVFMRQYQIEISTGRDKVAVLTVDDFDLTRKFEQGKVISVPVYCDLYQYEKNGVPVGAPRIAYHAIQSGNGNGQFEKKEEKKTLKV